MSKGLLTLAGVSAFLVLALSGCASIEYEVIPLDDQEECVTVVKRVWDNKGLDVDDKTTNIYCKRELGE